MLGNESFWEQKFSGTKVSVTRRI